MTAWMSRAACAAHDPELFFPSGHPPPAAVAVCGGCPVREECLGHALENPWLDGVWGGLGPGQRQELRRGTRGRAYYRPVECGWCGTTFTPTNGNQRYCKRVCGRTAYEWQRGRRRDGPPTRVRA